ncbi:Predicted transcriptional regulator, ArsR family [Mycolicibacterium rutilum]|uniref:Predicted transcriptional regulator, ArsR family n=1 Tax=Mycolicibacterium rutilum TaxID=370526 RepID=A0A1H6IT43_MYCRU|nr:helix-turn-helix domain-containing protein [Mycolicibacterium rutilum]SEH52044.1 Predicted transcriptional regulator, ArsR family [Mycolicibacterium rutilum]
MGRRDDVLAALRTAGAPLSIGDIAERLSIHPNTARFHLDALVKRGRAETVPPERAKPGRPPMMFRATATMDPDGPRDYRVLAGVLADALSRQRDPRGRAVAAGRAWAVAEGMRLSGPGRAVDRLTEFLDELGFDPEYRPRTGTLGDIALKNCPFLELAVSHRDVVCPVHLGIMQGALAVWEAPLTVDTLIPFAEPGMCVATLAPKEES